MLEAIKRWIDVQLTLSPEVAAVLGEEAELRAKVTEGDNGLIVIEEGQITSPHVQLLADGTFARPTREVDMILSLSAGAGLAQPFDGVDFEGAGFQGNVKGAPGDLGAEGTLTLDGLRTAFADVGKAVLETRYRQIEVNAEVSHEISTSGQTQGLRIDQLQPSVFGNAETEMLAVLTGDLLELETFWLNSDVISTSLSGSANIETQDAELLFGLATNNLARATVTSWNGEANRDIFNVDIIERKSSPFWSDNRLHDNR